MLLWLIGVVVRVGVVGLWVNYVIIVVIMMMKVISSRMWLWWVWGRWGFMMIVYLVGCCVGVVSIVKIYVGGFNVCCVLKGN